MSVNRARGRLGYNMMLFDMGVEIHPGMTAIEVRQAIDVVDNLFDIVLISEKLDESLILLKELLCWEFKDIVFFTKNARREDKKGSLTDENIEKLKVLNSADMMLYEHFLLKHEQAVMRYGEDKMAQEISKLNYCRNEFFKTCNIEEVQTFKPDSIFKEFSDQVNGYVIDTNASEECLLLTLPELSLVEKIRKKTEILIDKANREKN